MRLTTSQGKPEKAENVEEIEMGQGKITEWVNSRGEISETY